MVGGCIPPVRKSEGIGRVILNGIRIYHFLATLRHVMSASRNGKVFKNIFVDIKIKSALTMVVCKCSCGLTSGLNGFNPIVIIVFRNLFNHFGVRSSTNTAGVSHHTGGNMRCRSSHLSTVPRVTDFIVDCTAVSANIPVIFSIVCTVRCIVVCR